MFRSRWGIAADGRAGRLAVVLAMGVLLSGCGLGYQAVRTAQGGYSDLLVIQPLQPLEGYDTVHYVPLANDVGRNVSQSVLDTFNSRVKSALIARGVTPPGAKALRFSGRIVHIQAAEALYKEVVVRVVLADDRTGKVLGVANITGQASGISDLDDMADGLADGVVKLLHQGRFPQL